MKKYFQELWQGFRQVGHHIAVLTNSLLLVMMYVLGIGLAKLIWFASGKRAYHQSPADADSYWEPWDDQLTKRPYRSY